MTVCNTHVAPVRDSRLTYYMCQYQTKSHGEELNVFMSVVNEFRRQKERYDEEAKHYAQLTAQLQTCTDATRAEQLRTLLAQAPPPRNDYRRGLGHLLSGVRARSGDEVIPSQMAAFLLLGGHVYSYGDDCSPLPVAQCMAFVKGQRFMARVLRAGRLSCTINDYVHRPPHPQFDTMHLWQFVSEYFLKLIQRNRKRAKPRSDDEADGDAPFEDIRTTRLRSLLLFQMLCLAIDTVHIYVCVL
jgi:hypothetical protein